MRHLKEIVSGFLGLVLITNSGCESTPEEGMVTGLAEAGALGVALAAKTDDDGKTKLSSTDKKLLWGALAVAVADQAYTAHIKKRKREFKATEDGLQREIEIAKAEHQNHLAEEKQIRADIDAQVARIAALEATTSQSTQERKQLEEEKAELNLNLEALIDYRDQLTVGYEFYNDVLENEQLSAEQKNQFRNEVVVPHEELQKSLDALIIKAQR